ncbi:hypothetical protein AB0O01_02000 [Streptomyces sp. NPDC093252]
MAARVDHLVTSGQFTLDGGTCDVLRVIPYTDVDDAMRIADGSV